MDIAEHFKTCKTCQLVNVPNKPYLGKLQPIPTPEKTMEVWSLDALVMGSVAKQTRAKYIQVLIDHHSRYVWAFATPKNTIATVITILRQLKQIIGLPRILITDNGTNFTSKEFNRLMGDNGIEHRLTSSYHPQANGMLEKVNHILTNGLRLSLLDNPKIKWSTHLNKVVSNYNRVPHSATGFSPQFLHFGLLIPTEVTSR